MLNVPFLIVGRVLDMIVWISARQLGWLVINGRGRERNLKDTVGYKHALLIASDATRDSSS
jgi:hypothetical protein